MMDRIEIFRLIQQERGRQNEQWGGEWHDAEHGPRDWGAFITKQTGRMVELEALTPDYTERLVKIAALAVAALEVGGRP